MKSIGLIIVFAFFYLGISGQNYVQFHDEESENKEWFRFVEIVDSSNVFILSSNYNNEDTSSVVFSRGFDTKKMDMNWRKHSLLFKGLIYQAESIKNEKGNFIFTGSTIGDFFNENSYLSEITPEGDHLWFSEYESDQTDRVEDVAEIDTGYLMVGWQNTAFDETGHRYSHAYVRKLNFSGDSLWTVYFSDNEYQDYKGQRVVSTDFNSVYLAYNKDGSQGSSVWLSKLDGHTGEIFWEKEIGFNKIGFGINDLIRLENNNLLIVGDLFDQGCPPLILWEVDEDGNVVSKKDDFTEFRCWHGQGFSSTNDGGFVAFKNEIYPKLIKFDKEYNVEWIQTYELDKKMYATDVVQKEDGNFIIIGGFGSKSGVDASGWLIKTNINGAITSIVYPSDSNIKVKTFPNPTQSLINISVSGIEEHRLTLKLFDNNSKEIFYSEFEDNIDLSILISGIYYLHIFDKEKLIRVEKIVKI